MDKPYQPVSCALHSALELAALQHRQIILFLHNGDPLRGQIMDVWTAAGREWVRLRQDVQERDLDLTLIDHIQEIIHQ